MLTVNEKLCIPETELVTTAIRASGPGGQNVNKVSSAVQLRFDIGASPSLEDEVKARLLGLPDRRISKAGVVVIKSQRYRHREQNVEDARRRLVAFILKGLEAPTVRKKTRPPRRVAEQRLDNKSRRAAVKRLRRPVDD